MSFIKLPEIQLQTNEVMSFFLKKPQHNWIPLPWGQYVCISWKDCKEIVLLKSAFTDLVKISMIECMKFNPGTGLPIHKDGKRLAVIQLPLSSNCQSTPTLFYKDDKTLVNKIEWIDNSAWLFDTHTMHSVQNDSSEPRYMLCLSFYEQNYTELVKMYNDGLLFKVGDRQG